MIPSIWACTPTGQLETRLLPSYAYTTHGLCPHQFGIEGCVLSLLLTLIFDLGTGDCQCRSGWKLSSNSHNVLAAVQYSQIKIDLAPAECPAADLSIAELQITALQTVVDHQGV